MQDASEAGETQDFRISQAILVEVQQGIGYERSKEHQRDKSEDQRACEATKKADTVNNQGTNITEYLENAVREIHDYAVNSSGANNYVALTLAS
ncbi:hypothetical protein EAI_03090 [Harpegnathos saltator]|uniref:Uncharacterized protein n=1 Tax=Harpegnathos saltator TaxID=610380 RepID=E2BER5_HARSA|nr:hypothetical protein EAI_03090 [Harpegnathos saltator]